MFAFPIRDDADLSRAINLVDQLWDAPSDSPEADLREVMAELIETYEARELSQILPPPDPSKVIEAKRKRLGISGRELGRRLGWSAGRVSEVVSGKRGLTLSMVRDLERVLGIDPGVLVANRSPSTNGTVWVQLPADLVASAQKAEFGGSDSLETLVRAAVEARLRPQLPTTVMAPGARIGAPLGSVPPASGWSWPGR